MTLPELSSGAWIALICLAGTVVVSGLVLFSAWRQREKGSPSMFRKGRTPSFTESWEKEDEQLRELSARVRNLGSDKKDST